MLELLPWEEEHAAALNRAVAESVQHLRPWMAWASEPPMDIERRRAWIRAQRESGDDRLYGMWIDGRVVGGCGVHRRIAPGGLEIGYWVHTDFVRRGLATEAVRRVTEIAFSDPELDRVEIHHDVNNVASGGVARAAGFSHVEDRADVLTAPGDAGIERVWRLTREEFAAREGDATRSRPDRAPE